MKTHQKNTAKKQWKWKQNVLELIFQNLNEVNLLLIRNIKHGHKTSEKILRYEEKIKHRLSMLRKEVKGKKIKSQLK